MSKSLSLPSEKGYTRKGKNLLQQRENSFLLEYSFSKWAYVQTGSHKSCLPWQKIASVFSPLEYCELFQISTNAYDYRVHVKMVVPA